MKYIKLFENWSMVVDKEAIAAASAAASARWKYNDVRRFLISGDVEELKNFLSEKKEESEVDFRKFIQTIANLSTEYITSPRRSEYASSAKIINDYIMSNYSDIVDMSKVEEWLKDL